MKTITQKIPHQAGFTLIELMITIFILAILVSIAVPAMTSFMNSNRLTAHTSELKQAIQYARSEAVSRNQDVSICASSDGATCTGDGDWTQGWIVRLAGDGTVLRVWNGLSDNYVADGITTTFLSTGERFTGDVPFAIKHVTDAAYVRNLEVSNVGWVTVTKGGSS